MVTISNSTLRANVYETVYDLIKAISFSLSSSNSVTVTAAFIDKAEALPQVVISPADIDISNNTFDRSSKMREIRVLVEVFANKKKDIDQMADKIVNTIEGASHPGMQLVNTSESNAFINPNQLKIHSKAIAFTFNRYS